MKNTLLFILFFASQNLFAQEVYTNFTNPSFEDIARPQHPPYGWWDCGFNEETPPDTHPVSGNPPFGVSRPAQDRNTYLGLVVRENDTWESVAQRLNEPLLPNECYAFSIFLCTSETYTSELKNRPGAVSFTEPVLLRVWGGTGFCNKKEILAESTLIDHHDWREYSFRISPTEEHTYLVLEAFYATPTTLPPNGNLLLDNLSPIYAIDCNDLDTVNIKRPESTPIVQLENFIIGSGNKIEFNYHDKLTYKSESILERIIAQTKVSENIKLIFSIKTKNKDQIKALKNFLTDQGLPNKQYTVRAVERSDKRDYWFSENDFLYIGLQDLE